MSNLGEPPNHLTALAGCDSEMLVLGLRDVIDAGFGAIVAGFDSKATVDLIASVEKGG